MQISVTPYAQPTQMRDSSKEEWVTITEDIGCQNIPGVGVQINTRRGGWYTIKVDNWGPYSGYLPPRAMLTIRPDSPPPTLGLLRPHGKPWDFSAGGGQGIDACGTPGTIHDHDSMMQRNPLGLYDMFSGKLRNPESIPVEGYYTGPHGFPWNKTTQLPDYSIKWNAIDPYDDRRLPKDATQIPENGTTIKSEVLGYTAMDYQHWVRAYRFGLLLLRDKFVQRDFRAFLRDAEVAWGPAKEAAILEKPGGKGHADTGREFGWIGRLTGEMEKLDNRVLVFARRLFGIGFASRLRRIARHVQHTETGLLQRFVEGMSGSPYPYSPPPDGSGVETGRGIALAQDIEAYAQVTCLDALGLTSECKKLCKTVLTRPLLKWINTDTGAAEGFGNHGPAEDQVWPAMGVWLRLDRRAALPAVTRHRVPANSGAWYGPFPTVEGTAQALAAWNDHGKTRWALDQLRR